MVIKIIQKEYKITKQEQCPECEGNLIATSFEKICQQCGLVISEIYGETSYVFNNNNKNTRKIDTIQQLRHHKNYIRNVGSNYATKIIIL